MASANTSSSEQAWTPSPSGPELASRLLVFEIDRPGAQAWKRQRLADLGLGIPSLLRLVPVDFEAGDTWWERLAASGFDSGSRRSWRPPVSACT